MNMAFNTRAWRGRHAWALFLVIGLALAVASVQIHAATVNHISSGSHATEWHQWLEMMAERFEAKTGIKVDVEVGPGASAYREQVVVRTAGGLAPDVTDFSPHVGAILVYEGMFEDLRPYIEASGVDMAEYPPVAIEATTAPDGSIWGFPVSILPIPVYFNADMFALSGLANPNELGEDWTWDTYFHSARMLTVHDADGIPVQAGTIDPRRRWQQLVAQGGGLIFDRHVFPTESRLNSPEVLAGMEWRQRFFDENLIALTGGVWNGNVALTNIDGPTIINKFAGGFNMDVALQPKGPGGRGAYVTPDGFQIHADSLVKDEAWQWVHFLVTDEEGLEQFTYMTGRLPTLRSIMLEYGNLNRDELTPNWYALIETSFAPDSQPPYMMHDARINDILNAEFDKIWKGTDNPAVVLQQAHEQMEGLLRSMQQ